MHIQHLKMVSILFKFVGDRGKGVTMAGILCCITPPGGILVNELRQVALVIYL